MARAKEPPKPVFPLKHEFYASMDNVLQQASLLHTALDTALKSGVAKGGHICLPTGVVDMLRDANGRLHKAMYGEG